MTSQDGTSTVWDCCGSWECMCGVEILQQPVIESLMAEMFPDEQEADQ